ncbi:MAG TPA: PilZ domain-containing protein [Terriglobales bacterium]|nr:PilZ domain-containing protein [Terriglobales bacterium]
MVASPGINAARLPTLMDDRPEDRVDAQIIVRVWGMDADGRPFFQNVNAGNISSEGALLSGVRHRLKVGDTIGIQHNDQKARFKVVWVKDAAKPRMVDAGVQILPSQRSPWVDLAKAGEHPVAQGKDKRRFQRHKVLFPIEISFDDTRRTHLQTNATDIGGRGCYVETLLPLQLGTKVNIKFWVESENVQTSGIVRTSDPGVGMGIEFMALDNVVQEWLQAYLDKLDDTVGGKAKGAGGGK